MTILACIHSQYRQRYVRRKQEIETRRSLVRREEDLDKRLRGDEAVAIGQGFTKQELLVYAKRRQIELNKGIQLRGEQEKDTSKGEPVWFSRHVFNGSLKHWVLMVHDHKYELRRSRPGETRTQDIQGATRGDPGYICSVTPFTVDQEFHERRIRTVGAPEIDEYYVCLIGWTRATKEEVVRIGQEEMKRFGSYNLVLNNCQDFLRRLAARILVQEKAADYRWFADNTKTQYQRDQAKFPPPLVELQRRTQRAIDAINGNIAHQHNVQTQVTLNGLAQLDLNSLVNQNIQNINNQNINNMNINQNINNMNINQNINNMNNQIMMINTIPGGGGA